MRVFLRKVRLSVARGYRETRYLTKIPEVVFEITEESKFIAKKPEKESVNCLKSRTVKGLGEVLKHGVQEERGGSGWY